MAKLFRHDKPHNGFGRQARHSLEGLERVTAPPIEGSSYEFMLESLTEQPTDRFDRWRNRTPQG